MPNENNTQELLQFDQPTALILHGDGSDSAYWYNLPVPTRLRAHQIIDWGEGATDDFLIYDGFFELVIGYVGQLEIWLDADGYEQQYTMFDAIEPIPAPSEDTLEE